jgi:predicted DNA-binding transcriptional regulator YafY
MTRRADRLFALLQVLRRQGGRATTAAAIAEALEVSLRTVYRDVRDLQARRVPIEGEAGVGYILREGFDLPPLMLTEDEIDALVIGARVVQSWGDPKLAEAARDVLAKVEAVLPGRLRPRVRSLMLMAPPSERQPEPRIDLAELRLATREQRKVDLDYVSERGERTQRTIWPMALAFFPPVWLVLAWCELRQDFRSFRVDRIETAGLHAERYPDLPGRRLVDFLKREAERRVG